MEEDKLKKVGELPPAGAGDGDPGVRAGRMAMLERWRGEHPDVADDPSDDDLWEYGHRGMADRDEWRSKYDALNGSNENLVTVIGSNPRFAQFIAMVANGEDLAYSLGKTFGNLLDNLDDEALEKYRAGQKEFNDRYAKVKENFASYERRLDAYAAKHNLSDEQRAAINDAILDLSEAFMERDISDEVIEIVHKGLDYDEDRAAELEAAELAGKNKAIDEMKNKKAAAVMLPDTGAGKTQPKPRPKVNVDDDEGYKPYVNSLKVVK